MSNLLMPAESSLSHGSAKATNLALGGQQGHMTDSVNWMSTEDYLKPQMISVLLAAPEGFEYLPDGKERRRFLKAMVEELAISVTGINTSLTNEPVETVVGNTEFFEQSARVARERSRPVFSWIEKRGKVIKNIIYTWMTELMSDPDTGKAGIITRQAYRDAGSPELTAPFKTMACLFIEPDETMTRVVDCVIGVNMAPQGIINEMQMVKGQALETVQHDIEFSMHQRVGSAVFATAQQYMDELNMAGFNANDAPAFMDTIHNLVTDEATQTGYSDGAQRIADAIGG